MGTLNLSYGNFRAQAVMFDQDTTVDIGGGYPAFPCLAHTPYAFPSNDTVELGTANVTVAYMVNAAGMSGKPLQCFAIELVALIP